jgi:hypothetical protein
VREKIRKGGVSERLGEGGRGKRRKREDTGGKVIAEKEYASIA